MIVQEIAIFQGISHIILVEVYTFFISQLIIIFLVLALTLILPHMTLVFYLSFILLMMFSR